MNCLACDISLEEVASVSDIEIIPYSYEHPIFLGLCVKCGRELSKDLVKKFAAIKRSKEYAKRG